jgi:mono/diheme cytochrome c family protein
MRSGRATLDETLRILRNGVDGTDMAAWGGATGRLSEAELSAVAYYVQTLLPTLGME